MLNVWMDQLRVKNKHMKDLTNSSIINFSSDPEFNF
jgi:hypothetical protein